LTSGGFRVVSDILVYVYLTASTARMLAASMQCWRMVRALRSHGRCWLVVSSDEMSPYASHSRTSSVTDRVTHRGSSRTRGVRRLVVGWSLTCQLRRTTRKIYASSVLLSNVHFVELLSSKPAGPLKRPSQSTIASFYDITGSFTTCRKSHRFQTRLRLLQNVVLSTRLLVVVQSFSIKQVESPY